MAGRALGPTLSTTEDLTEWQMNLLQQMSQLHGECFEERKALTKIIQGFAVLQGAELLIKRMCSLLVVVDKTQDMVTNCLR